MFVTLLLLFLELIFLVQKNDWHYRGYVEVERAIHVMYMYL